MAVGALLVGLLLHRPGVVVLGVPFVVAVVWSLVTRPRGSPRVHGPGRTALLREGQSVRWTYEVSVPPGTQQGALLMAQEPFLAYRPRSGAVAEAVLPEQRGPLRLPVAVRSTRWGSRPLGRALVGCSGPWAGYVWGPVPVEGRVVTTLPVPSPFDSAAAMPHPVGLVGLNRSAARGEGAEFATIRPFQVGDRLRRVHWPVSLRTGALHVSATYADQDELVMLVVDATTDLGESEGIDGAASSLDVTVRAAGAIAEHFLRRGERVGLRVFGPVEQSWVPPAAGRAHLRRVLYQLATITPANVRTREAQRFRFGFGAGTLVVMLSACISPLALQQAMVLQGRGLQVLVVDTLSDVPPDPDPYVHAAWRIRLLERASELRQVGAAGVPIVPWHGAGSLDQVLRDLARRPGAARGGRR